MNETVGVRVSWILAILIVVLFVFKEYLRLKRKNLLLADTLSWIIIILPAIYMTIIGNEFVWNKEYLTKLDPSGDPNAALTYSPFHISWLILMVLGCVYVSYRALTIDRVDDKRYFGGIFSRSDYTIFKAGVLLLTIEIYKQIVTLHAFTNYNWEGFPYQFCSVPIYVLLLLPFIKEGKVKDALYYFLGIFALSAGLGVMFVIGNVYSDSVAMCVHTMIWHGTMVIIGIYAVVYKNMGLKIKEYLSGITVLLILVLFAQVLNNLFHFIDPDKVGPGRVDLFYISPYLRTDNMMILSTWRLWLQDNLPGAFLPALLYTIIYLLVFALGGILVYSLESLVKYFITRKEERNLREQTEQNENN
jgi:hypothetical protein